MKKLMSAAAIAATATLGLGAAALANTELSSQDFSADAADWAGDSSHNAADETLEATGSTYSYYQGVAADPLFRTTPIGDGLISELDFEVVSAELSDGQGFDLAVATSDVTTGDHQQDHIFHVGMVGGQVLVNSSNNTDFATNSYKLLNENGGAYGVLSDGWYTLQHVFGDDGNGFGQVTFNVIDRDSGVTAWTAVRPIRQAGFDVPTAEVGGVRYMWLTHMEAPFTFDNQLLEQVVAAPHEMDQCKKGGFEAFGFKNQGQCVASIQANGNAHN